VRLEDFRDPSSLVAGVMARGLRPPPSVDIRAWAIRNVRFGSESNFQGPFDPSRFPYWDRLFEVLSPDHPARVVALRGSAQTGKTVVAELFLGATQDLDPCPFMYTHPTESNVREWVRGKWWPMIRKTPVLSRHFDSRSSKEGGTSLERQERRDGRGSILFSSANSASELSLRSIRRQVQDDLSKWSNLPEGDPEGLADDRSKAFPWAKIFKISTPALADNCRITEAFKRGTQEHYHVPCPHCGHKHPLEWNDFRARVEDVGAEKGAHFVCPECGGVIEEKHRAWMVRPENGAEWVAHNPNPRPGWVSFHIWAAYAGLESWAELARVWLDAKGDPADEQRVINTTGGEPYEQPGEAPPWEELKARGEASQRLRGLVPLGALLLALTFDCQDDYVDGMLTGYGSNLRRWVIERIRVEGHVSTPECRAELNKLVERGWPTAVGSRRRADLTGIDANAFTDDVFDWAKTHPKSRVIMVRGVPGDASPTLAIVRRERRRDGKLVKYAGRFFNVGTWGLKGALYRFLRVEDRDARGYIDFPAQLEDDYYEQLTAEKRVAVLDRKGFTSYQWIKPRSARNEMLDCAVYGEALAGKLGWRTLTPAGWAALEAEREVAAAHSAPQSDLFATPQIAPSLTRVSETENSEPAAPAPSAPQRPVDSRFGNIA
jgi:phage terminase large subunit GpA-like protein